jgi:hypothetical protein
MRKSRLSGPVIVLETCPKTPNLPFHKTRLRHQHGPETMAFAVLQHFFLEGETPAGAVAEMLRFAPWDDFDSVGVKLFNLMRNTRYVQCGVRSEIRLVLSSDFPIC